MQDSNKQKLIVFSNDLQMNQAVYDFLLDVFLEGEVKQDVNISAASYLAVGKLKKGFQKIDSLANNDPNNTQRPGPIGL